jgi:hypothetical protein
MKKAAPSEAAKLLIPEAGHGIRTRDFDLGNLVLNWKLRASRLTVSIPNHQKPYEIATADRDGS